MEIKVKSKENQDGVIVNYDVPESTNAFIEKFGEEQTHALASRALILGVQALARQKLTAGASVEDIQAAVSGFVPGVRGPVAKKSPLERAQAALGAMSAEDLAALLAKVKAAQKAAQ